ncbi:MAG TPA: TolC family protein [Chthonomonadaceae bacterium]|nr:TolC family protein [Chthonomonadaceae bacterium]
MVSCAALCFTAAAVCSAQTSPGTTPPQTPAQAPTPPNTAIAPSQTPPSGVITLPQGPPPTGLQAPLPAPVRPAPPPNAPALASPTLVQLLGRMPPGPLSLEDAVAIALATNRSLALAGEQVLLAQGRTAEARAAFNPTVGGTFTFLRYNKGQSVTFGTQHIVVLQQYQEQLGIQATLPVDIAGLLHTATRQAQFQEVAARLDVNRARNQIVSDVKTAFYNVLRAQALVTVATETLNDDLARLSDAQKRYTAGIAARFDVIRAQTDVASAQQQLIQARSNVSLALASLNNTIGIDVNSPTAVTDQGAVETPPGVAPPNAPPATPQGITPQTPEGGAPPQTPPANSAGAVPPATPPGSTPAPPAAIQTSFDTLDLGPTYNAALQEALRLRPEIMESEASIAAAQQGITLARRSELPGLGLSYGLTYVPNTTTFSANNLTGLFTATLSVPIFDGSLARARVEQARANVATAETDRRQTVDLVNLQVRQAYLNLLQSRDRVAVANQALAEAQESYRLARVRYNAGVTTLLEVSDAQAALSTAESNQVNALYDYNNNRALLDQAIGRYSYTGSGPGYPAPPPPKTVGAH